MNHVKQIIRVRDDGTREDVGYGILMEAKGSKVLIDFLNINSLELVECAIRLLLAIDHMGLTNLMAQMFEEYNPRKEPERNV